MNKKSLLFISLLVLGTGLSACSAESEPSGVIPQGNLDALEKANDVSDMLLEADEERKKRMEEEGI